MKRSTDNREFVETHNLLLSLNRLGGAPYDGNDRLKRALYHALLANNSLSRTALDSIRQALELP